MRVVQFELFDDVIPARDIWNVIASAEGNSKHPIAKALVDAAQGHDCVLQPVMDIKTVGGRGLSCTVNGASVVIGNLDWISESGIHTGLVSVRCLGSRTRVPRTLLCCLPLINYTHTRLFVTGSVHFSERVRIYVCVFVYVRARAYLSNCSVCVSSRRH